MTSTAADQTSPGSAAIPVLTIHDETSERQDLAKRAEVKYALDVADIGKLRSNLATNCRRQVHNNPVSVVRSIYFDDAALSSCHANLDGIGSRRKLRLRWYDTLAPRNEFYLEIKWRETRVTGKHRLKVQSTKPVEQMTWSELYALLDPVVPEHFRCALLRFPEPIIIVQYDREHFTSLDGQLRMTLDYNLTYYDQVGTTRVSTRFPQRLGDLVVVEGKVPVGHEPDLRRLLHPFVPRATRCSKYVHGCSLLNHVYFVD